MSAFIAGCVSPTRLCPAPSSSVQKRGLAIIAPRLSWWATISARRPAVVKRITGSLLHVTRPPTRMNSKWLVGSSGKAACISASSASCRSAG